MCIGNTLVANFGMSHTDPSIFDDHSNSLEKKTINTNFNDFRKESKSMLSYNRLVFLESTFIFERYKKHKRKWKIL